jgi:hypothetical protein
MATKKTEKGSRKRPENLDDLKILDAPNFVAQSMSIQGNGNGFLLLFQQRLPLQTPDGALYMKALKNTVVATVTLSPQTLKDLSLVLSDTVGRYEKEFGKIETPYTRRRAANEKSGKTA